MNHESNDWIEKHWLGKNVKQIDGIPSLIGRTGIVEKTIWDEKGALHCQMTGGWWCPASLLWIYVPEFNAYIEDE